MKNNYVCYGLLIFSTLIFANDNDNQIISGQIQALASAFDIQTISDSKNYEIQHLLPNTISRSFTIETAQQVAEKIIGSKEFQSKCYKTTYLNFFSGDFSVWNNNDDYLVLKGIDEVMRFKSHFQRIFCETDNNIWIAEGKNDDTASLWTLCKKSNSACRINLQFSSPNYLHHDLSNNAIYLTCNNVGTNRKIYKISTELPYNVQMVHEITDSSGPYHYIRAHHLSHDQIFIIKSNNYSLFLKNLPKNKDLSYIETEISDAYFTLSTSKKMLALFGQKRNYDFANTKKLLFDLNIYDISNVETPKKIKSFTFQQPIFDVQFVPMHDNKIIIVIDTPFSEQLKLYDFTTDSTICIDTDHVKLLHFTPEYVYFYNTTDKKVTNWEKKEVDTNKQAIYRVNYKALYMYQLLKTYKKLPSDETAFKLTRDNKLEAPEYQ